MIYNVALQWAIEKCMSLKQISQVEAEALQNVSEVTILNVREIQEFLQRLFRGVTKGESQTKYLGNLHFLHCTISSLYFNEVIVICMVNRLIITTFVLPGKVPSDNQKRCDTNTMAATDDDPWDVVPLEEYQTWLLGLNQRDAYTLVHTWLAT